MEPDPISLKLVTLPQGLAGLLVTLSNLLFVFALELSYCSFQVILHVPVNWCGALVLATDLQCTSINIKFNGTLILCKFYF